jgi:Rad3-related DNA helicase
LFPWRDYQARALEELDTHLNDEHLHLVAPPGAGKTVLGLEIMLRLNRKTLILAPSIAIREQWIHHFCTFFLQETALPVWISRDLRTPGFMTVSTYQALHQLMGRELDRESFLHSMQKTSKTLLILDEAHHLKRAWWTSLQQVKETVQPMVLGLTATPPYDASAAEWQRYQSLNGPIDTEISVPELVRSGDLCPHQDFVYFCQPSSSDQEAIKSVRDKIKDLLDEARIDITLLDAIQSLPMITHPAEHTEEILEAVDIYSSCLIYLHDMGQEIEYEQLAIIGAEKIRIPALDYSWLEVLLNFFIWSEFDHFRPFEEHQTLWRKNSNRPVCSIENASDSNTPPPFTVNCRTTRPSWKAYRPLLPANISSWEKLFAWWSCATTSGLNISPNEPFPSTAWESFRFLNTCGVPTSRV